MASPQGNTSTPTAQPQISYVRQDQAELHSLVRDQLDAPPSRRGSDPFVEGSRNSAASGNPHQSVPRILTTERDAPQPQRSLHESNASIEAYDEKRALAEDPREAGPDFNNVENHGQPRYSDNVDDRHPEHINLSPPSQIHQSMKGEVSRAQSQRQRNGDTRQSVRPSFVPRQSALDWIVPSTNEPKASTLAQRLQPTIDVAIAERDKYALKAKWTGWTLNAAIGAQVLLGSLTTGLSAVATAGGKSTAVSTTALGALATLVASYLARARGSNEPELSITRVKDLEQFIRECEAFKMDNGHITGHELDHELESKRRRFEELLGNANGERRLAPPV